MRARVSAEIEPTHSEDEVRVVITCTDGSSLETHVEHATGSPENPMSDDALEAKFSALVGAEFGEAHAKELLSAIGALDGAADVSQVAKFMTAGS